jgi:uncharacterized protein YndB with AHSA1/START domain
MSAVVLPDLSGRPRQLHVERAMRASPAALYRAWTQGFERWFAAPGTVAMTPSVGAPFFFQTHYMGENHSHYGRFLRLEPDRLVQMTWLTGAGGTNGAETVVTVTFGPAGNGALIKLTHAGFYDQASCDQHAAAWPLVLAQQDERIGDER